MVRPTRSPYQYVEVIGLAWEGHNHQQRAGPVFNADQELGVVMDAFKNYGFATGVTRIPRDPNRRSQTTHYLQQKFDRVAAYSPASLIIVYYQGHGSLDRSNTLVLSNGNGQCMHWSAIADAAISARCDVLTILNCCHAGAALNTPFLARRNLNYESHIKEVMMAVPWNGTSRWGSPRGFAYSLERALREQHKDWPRGFRGTAGHWAQAINRIQNGNGVRVGSLVRPPPHASSRPLVLARRH